MKTIIFDPVAEKIKVVLSGPSSLHGKTISEFPGFKFIEFEGETVNKKPIFIDGSWQIVDDEEKILSEKKSNKNKSIEDRKSIALAVGIDISGEIMIDGAWNANTIAVYFAGTDKEIMDRHIKAYNAIGLLPPASQAQRFLKGRATYNILLGNRRIVFNNFNDFGNFIQAYQEKRELSEIIETEKKEAVIMAQTIDEVDLIDENSGWEELNG